MEPDRKIDCLGLYCPEPIFRTRLTLDEMERGEILQVIADDPAAKEDIKRLADKLGHKLIHFEKKNKELCFLIEKK